MKALRALAAPFLWAWHSLTSERLRKIRDLAVILTLALTIVLVWFVWTSLRNDARSERNNQLNACRSGYGGQLVTGARARYIDVPTAQALEALGHDDDDAYADALIDLDPEAYARSVDRYRKLVELSGSDPDAFLRRCRKDSVAG